MKYVAYLLRWQLSTLILWPCVEFIPLNGLVKTVIANLIGGLIFYWVDKKIFREKKPHL